MGHSCQQELQAVALTAKESARARKNNDEGGCFTVPPVLMDNGGSTTSAVSNEGSTISAVSSGGSTISAMEEAPSMPSRVHPKTK